MGGFEGGLGVGLGDGGLTRICGGGGSVTSTGTYGLSGAMLIGPQLLSSSRTSRCFGNPVVMPFCMRNATRALSNTLLLASPSLTPVTSEQTVLFSTTGGSGSATPPNTDGEGAGGDAITCSAAEMVSLTSSLVRLMDEGRMMASSAMMVITMQQMQLQVRPELLLVSTTTTSTVASPPFFLKADWLWRIALLGDGAPTKGAPTGRCAYACPLYGTLLALCKAALRRISRLRGTPSRPRSSSRRLL